MNTLYPLNNNQTSTLTRSKTVRHKLHCISKAVDYGYKPYITIDKKNDRIPKSIFEFTFEHFHKELQMRQKYGYRKDPYSNIYDREELNQIRRMRNNIKKLTLNDDNIWKRELAREQIDCPRIMMMFYYVICWFLDFIFKDKPIDRFWFLETIARMPYFSYVAVLHLYETLGWWETGSGLKKTHYDEEANETYHLRIMESLGGDSLWWNRFLARHGAVAYYIMLLVLFMLTPKYAFLFSELLELHAVDTYDEFCENNKELLSMMSPTIEAIDYLPNAENLYDVFMRISEDEYKHAQAMRIVRQLPK